MLSECIYTSGGGGGAEMEFVNGFTWTRSQSLVIPTTKKAVGAVVWFGSTYAEKVFVKPDGTVYQVSGTSSNQWIDGSPVSATFADDKITVNHSWTAAADYSMAGVVFYE